MPSNPFPEPLMIKPSLKQGIYPEDISEFLDDGKPSFDFPRGRIDSAPPEADSGPLKPSTPPNVRDPRALSSVSIGGSRLVPGRRDGGPPIGGEDLPRRSGGSRGGSFLHSNSSTLPPRRPPPLTSTSQWILFSNILPSTVEYSLTSRSPVGFPPTRSARRENHARGSSRYGVLTPCGCRENIFVKGAARFDESIYRSKLLPRLPLFSFSYLSSSNNRGTGKKISSTVLKTAWIEETRDIPDRSRVSRTIDQRFTEKWMSAERFWKSVIVMPTVSSILALADCFANCSHGLLDIDSIVRETVNFCNYGSAVYNTEELRE